MNKRDATRLRFGGINEIVDGSHLRFWPPAVTACYLVIWKNENAKTWTSQIGVPVLHLTTGYAESTCKRAVKALREAGYLKRIAGGSGSVPSVYKLRVPDWDSVDFNALWMKATRREMKPELAKKYAAEAKSRGAPQATNGCATGQVSGAPAPPVSYKTT